MNIAYLSQNFPGSNDPLAVQLATDIFYSKENLAIALVLAGKPIEAKSVLNEVLNNATDERPPPLMALIDQLISKGESPPQTLRQLEQSYICFQ